MLYENCVILNRSSEKDLTSMKGDVIELFDCVDFTYFDTMLNKSKTPNFARKIFFHLIIVHNVIKQYYKLSKDFYYIPFSFNKTDFFNSFNFIKRWDLSGL